MRTFKSLTKIQEASVLDIQEIGIPLAVAERIKDLLAKNEANI